MDIWAMGGEYLPKLLPVSEAQVAGRYGTRLRHTVVLWMMGTALHPYDHDSLDYTATPNLASELGSDGAFDDDVAMLEAIEGGEIIVAQPKNNKHMAEVKIMIGKIDRFKVRAACCVETWSFI
jgi:hypothetical protein